MTHYSEYPNRTSAVAAILDSWGGMRVVVTEPERMTNHVAKDELCFFVPDRDDIGKLWMVDEAWAGEYDNWPTVVRTAEFTLDRWIATRNDPSDLEHPCVAAYIIRRDYNKRTPGYSSRHIPELARP